MIRRTVAIADPRDLVVRRRASPPPRAPRPHRQVVAINRHVVQVPPQWVVGPGAHGRNVGAAGPSERRARWARTARRGDRLANERCDVHPENAREDRAQRDDAHARLDVRTPVHRLDAAHLQIGRRLPSGRTSSSVPCDHWSASTSELSNGCVLIPFLQSECVRVAHGLLARLEGILSSLFLANSAGMIEGGIHDARERASESFHSVEASGTEARSPTSRIAASTVARNMLRVANLDDVVVREERRRDDAAARRSVVGQRRERHVGPLVKSNGSRYLHAPEWPKRA